MDNYYWQVLTKNNIATPKSLDTPFRDNVFMGNVHEGTDSRSVSFLPLKNLLLSNTATGLLRYNGCVVPFSRLFLGGLGLGGYVYSEMPSIVYSDALPENKGYMNGSGDIQKGLALLAPRYILAEAPMKDGGYRRLVANLLENKWKVVERLARESPFVVFDKSRHKDIYSLLRAVNKKEYRNLRASRRKMQDAHVTRIEFWEKPLNAEIAAAMADVETKSNKAGIGIFSPDKFQQTLILLDNVPVRVALLYLDDSLAAWDLDIEHNSCIYSYNRAYDMAFASLAPGKVLHYENLDKAYERVDRAELLGDADSLKMRLATGVIKRARCAAFPPNLIGRVGWLAYLLHEKVKTVRRSDKR